MRARVVIEMNLDAHHFALLSHEEVCHQVAEDLDLESLVGAEAKIVNVQRMGWQNWQPMQLVEKEGS